MAIAWSSPEAGISRRFCFILPGWRGGALGLKINDFSIKRPGGAKKQRPQNLLEILLKTIPIVSAE